MGIAQAQQRRALEREWVFAWWFAVTEKIRSKVWDAEVSGC